MVTNASAICAARHGLVLAIPVRNPVQRAGERERGHLHVAGLDGAVLHAIPQQAADALVDLHLQRAHLRAHRRAQVLVLGAHHAPAEIRRHGLRVLPQHRVQPLARRGLASSSLPAAPTRIGSSPATKHSNSNCSLFVT